MNEYIDVYNANTDQWEKRLSNRKSRVSKNKKDAISESIERFKKSASAYFDRIRADDRLWK